MRNQLQQHAEAIRQTVPRERFVMGMQRYSRAELERVVAAGEQLELAGTTREVVAAWHANPGRVCVAGLSAGGAMAAILGQAYPERGMPGRRVAYRSASASTS
ncbi:PHB depolymerase family esterase [Massilia agilis]|uniref:PHB depolymerase family esterase n=1 Tax=Massilia agilis TaxID=1811226 RepID=UPI00351D1EE5